MPALPQLFKVNKSMALLGEFPNVSLEKLVLAFSAFFFSFLLALPCPLPLNLILQQNTASGWVVKNTIHFLPDLISQNVFWMISFQFAALSERKASKLMAASIVYASERYVLKKNFSKRNADLLKGFNFNGFLKMSILETCQECV